MAKYYGTFNPNIYLGFIDQQFCFTKLTNYQIFHTNDT